MSNVRNDLNACFPHEGEVGIGRWSLHFCVDLDELSQDGSSPWLDHGCKVRLSCLVSYAMPLYAYNFVPDSLYRQTAQEKGYITAKTVRCLATAGASENGPTVREKWPDKNWHDSKDCTVFDHNASENGPTVLENDPKTKQTKITFCIIAGRSKTSSGCFFFLGYSGVCSKYWGRPKDHYVLNLPE